MNRADVYGNYASVLFLFIVIRYFRMIMRRILDFLILQM